MHRITPHTSVQIWRGPAGAVVEKVHQHSARLNREHTALTTQAAALGCSPAFLHRQDLTIWMEVLPGRTHMPAELPAQAWVQAGDWLRRAHHLSPAEVDPLPLQTALVRRWSGVLRRAEPLVPAALLAECRSRVGNPADLATRRTWCHRDFTPDNWLWDSRRLSVLDFEHSRPDEPWSDLVKLEAGVFDQAPGSRAAFYAGYGTNPAGHQRLARLCWHGLATLTWGLRNDEAKFIALGRRILRDLLPTNPALGSAPKHTAR